MAGLPAALSLFKYPPLSSSSAQFRLSLSDILGFAPVIFGLAQNIPFLDVQLKAEHDSSLLVIPRPDREIHRLPNQDRTFTLIAESQNLLPSRDYKLLKPAFFSSSAWNIAFINHILRHFG